MAQRKTRRQFHQAVAALATVPLAAAVSPAAQQAKPDPQASAQALADIIRARYGKFLTEDQLKLIRQQLEITVRTRQLLHRPPTANADEPDFIFSADVI